ncbi:hypothetical protein BDY19DRAFT_19297 [Irpex rosettiformis]|uniref:Uncharacterized protein n=1 Tax=Irpex rosettiformis TaxID=378272 RepID=A0ACB8UJT5_9APHY|nr:hypothetical protein BDY19DRAFT_19297 [Irpex rosettiformis]
MATAPSTPCTTTPDSHRRIGTHETAGFTVRLDVVYYWVCRNGMSGNIADLFLHVPGTVPDIKEAEVMLVVSHFLSSHTHTSLQRTTRSTALVPGDGLFDVRCRETSYCRRTRRMQNHFLDYDYKLMPRRSSIKASNIRFRRKGVTEVSVMNIYETAS